MNRISFSQYQMWKQCPHRWKTSYIDKLKLSPPSIVLNFGTAMHTVIQNYLTVYYNDSVKTADSLDLCMELKNELIKEYTNNLAKNKGVHYSSSEEIKEYFIDGCKILEWLKKNKSRYFEKKNFKLVGMEYPIDLRPNKNNENVNVVGFLDIVVRNKETGKIYIYDLKTSVNGWNKYTKADRTKISQLVLYKSYYSKQYGVSPDDIEVEYIILKRKVNEEAEYPAMRSYMQRFVPSSGTVSRNYIMTEINKFIDDCFNPDGSYNVSRVYEASAGKNGKNCKFCELKEMYELCPKENRTYNE